METINATIGYRTINEGEVNYFGGKTDNGWCYKDLSAWESGEGIIYIGEYDLEEINEDCVIESHSWSKKDWVKWVKEVCDTMEFLEGLDDVLANYIVDYIAYNVLLTCDWQDLSTYLYEWDFDNDREEIIEICTKNMALAKL
jgi:PKD repeat protein